MKKRRQILLALIGIILVLAACSNEKTAGYDQSAAQSNAEIQKGNKESQIDSEDVSPMEEVDQEKTAPEKNKSGDAEPQEVQNTQPEGMDHYPSMAEISAALEDGKGIVYWLAPDPTVPDVCKTLNVETVNMEMLWNTILDRVFENASMIEEESPEAYRRYRFDWNDLLWRLELADISFELHCDVGIDGEILDPVPDIDGEIQDSILDILTKWTGMGLSFKNGEINHYAFTYNGLELDEYGYSPGGDEWVSDSIVSLGDGRIYIGNPVVIQGDRESISKESLLTMDSARAICEAYYRAAASGVPSVSIITNVELVYYFADNQLLPAWRLNGQQYITLDGYEQLSMLLDAVSGEIIRHA